MPHFLTYVTSVVSGEIERAEEIATSRTLSICLFGYTVATNQSNAILNEAREDYTKPSCMRVRRGTKRQE